MALIKQITAPNKVVVKYHRLERLRVESGLCTILVGSYRSYEERGSVMYPVHKMEFQFPVTASNEKDLVAASYAYLKTKPEFEGAVDHYLESVDLESLPSIPFEDTL